MLNVQIAQAESVFLVSFIKPLFALALVCGWAFVITKLDKDADYYYLQRQTFNLIQLACGTLGFLALLFIPFFIVGLIVCLLLMVGGMAGYWFYRNSEVPEEAKWHLSLDSLTNRVEAYQHGQAQKAATVVLLNKDESPRDVPGPKDPMAEPHNIVEQTFDWAMQRGAEQIDIQVTPEKAAIVVLVDGVKNAQPAIQPKVAMKVIEYLKANAGLDVSELRKRQRGEIYFRTAETHRHTAELITLGSSQGVQATLNLDADQMANRKLEDTGMLPSQIKQVRKLIETPGRVVLVAGPHHNGVRCTILSLLSGHDPYMQSIMTLELEKRFELEGVDHNVLTPPVAPKDFNDKLAMLIRTDPAAISLGALPDPSTAQLIAKSAEDVRFYLPVRADGAFAALKAYAKAVGDAKLAAESLGGIVAIRLIRKLCLSCRNSYTPDPAAVKKMNLPANRVTKLYKASGKIMVKDKPETCPICQGIGYRDRTGVFEVLVFDDLARSMIAANEGERLRSHLRKNNTLWMQEAALEKVVEGVTDIKEITRVLADKS